MKHVIHLATIEGLVDIDLPEFKSRIATQVIDVGKTASQQIIDSDDGISRGEQGVTEMRTEEAGSAGDEGARFAHEWLAFLGGAPVASGRASAVIAGRPTL